MDSDALNKGVHQIDLNPALHQNPICTDTRLSRIPEFTQHGPIDAASRSALSNTINGALPPSSNEFLHCLRIGDKILPTCVDPVKVTFGTRLSPVKTCPIPGIHFATQLITPAGMPA